MTNNSGPPRAEDVAQQQQSPPSPYTDLSIEQLHLAICRIEQRLDRMEERLGKLYRLVNIQHDLKVIQEDLNAAKKAVNENLLARALDGLAKLFKKHDGHDHD